MPRSGWQILKPSSRFQLAQHFSLDPVFAASPAKGQVVECEAAAERCALATIGRNAPRFKLGSFWQACGHLKP
jgi:hypothetical protein